MFCSKPQKIGCMVWLYQLNLRIIYIVIWADMISRSSKTVERLVESVVYGFWRCVLNPLEAIAKRKRDWSK